MKRREVKLNSIANIMSSLHAKSLYLQKIKIKGTFFLECLNTNQNKYYICLCIRKHLVSHSHI